MQPNRTSAVLLKLIEQMNNCGSWCGESHVQRSMYFLQEVVDIDSHFEFVIYKHAPYSFELSDALASLRANDIVSFMPQHYPYGPSICLTDLGETFLKQWSSQLEAVIPKIDHIAAVCAKKKVVELERLATAHFVSKTIEGDTSIESLVQAITRLKPHISREMAITAVSEVNEVLAEEA